MESATLMHMEPSLPMLAEAFPQGGLHCREPERYFRDIRLFNRDTRADPSVLYLVRPEDAAMFPGESCAGICQVPLKGDCLVLPRMEPLVSLNLEDPDQRLYLQLSLWILDRQNNKEQEKQFEGSC